MGIVNRRTAFPASIKVGDKIGVCGEIFAQGEYPKCLGTILEIKDFPCMLQHWGSPNGVAGTYRAVKVALTYDAVWDSDKNSNVLEAMSKELVIDETQYVTLFYERDFCREYGIKRNEILAANYKAAKTLKKGA